MSKFKVGDKVKVVRLEPENNLSRRKIGEIFIIDKILASCFPTIQFWIHSGEYINCETELELLERAEDKPKFKAGDRVKSKRTGKEYIVESVNGMEEYDNRNFISPEKGFFLEGDMWDFMSDYELVEVVEECSSCFKDWKIINKEQTTSSRNKSGNIMSKLTTFVKNSLLSADEKLLRKYDLKDSCGDYTSEAEQLVIKKLIKDNESYLIEIATALEKEEKKD